MKKYFIPTLLFAAVFCVSIFFQRYTLLNQEYLGLFLNTPDYLREVFDAPMPLSNLLGSFLVQFYRIIWAGPLITAAIVLAVWFLCKTIFRFTGRWNELAATLAASGAWIAIALSETPKRGAAILLICCAAAVVTAIVCRQAQKRDSAPKHLLPAAVILAAGILIICLPSVRKAELWGKVECCTRTHQWDKVIKAVNPSAAKEDADLMPFAFLAMSEKGILPENLFSYPVTGPELLDMERFTDRRAYYYKSMLSECIGCTNEAIHNTFQAACTIEHGTSFGTLRQLIKYNLASGNLTMARKYNDILGRSPFNAGTAKAVAKRISEVSYGSQLHSGASDSAAVVIKSNFPNMRLMLFEGYFNQPAADRLRCHLLLQRDITNLASTFNEEETDYTSLPRCFQEALLILSVPEIDAKISPEIKDDFAAYLEKLNTIREKGERFSKSGTYWDYYFLEDAEDDTAQFFGNFDK